MSEQDTGRLWLNDGVFGVTMGRAFPIPVEALWDWVTNPDRLAGWYCLVTGTFAPGGDYQMHFGDETGTGTIQQCDPPYGFTATWDHAGEPASLLTITLAPDGPSQSRLTLDHERLPGNQTAGHAAGWHSYLDRLEAAVTERRLNEWWPRWEEVIDGYREQHSQLTSQTGTRG